MKKLVQSYTSDVLWSLLSIATLRINKYREEAEEIDAQPYGVPKKHPKFRVLVQYMVIMNFSPEFSQTTQIYPWYAILS